jgi:phenylalanyl-tRNA synthetase beta chain
MKVSYNWLKQVVDIPVDAEALATALTMVGLQLESKEEHGSDITLDFEITVNRPDCLSLFGLAREIGVLFQSPAPAMPDLHSSEILTFRGPEGHCSPAGRDIRIFIEDPELCPRYCGQLITGVKVQPSPEWMQERLEACGVRSLNNVVDVTNYVLLELGQPMHAFDFDKISESTIRVRKARNEKLLMIDGKERMISENMLAIADAYRVVAVGGVMGGVETEVTDSTTAVLLESAYFQPVSVRSTAKKLELSTDASYRFERGVDYKMQAVACRRAAALLTQCTGGTAHAVIDVAPGKFVQPEIRFRHQRITRILGQQIDPHLADNILTALGFIKKAEHLWQVPSFRVDVFREIDLIEEIARHNGYNNIPSTLPKTDRKYQTDYPTFEMERATAQFLRGAGFDEAYTYSYGSGSDPNAIKILNPISETMSSLRTSLLPNLRQSIEFNIRHRNENVRLFEIGRVFLPDGEKIALGIVAMSEYREIKGIVEALFHALQYETPTFGNGSIQCNGPQIGAFLQTTAEGYPLQLCEIYLSDLQKQPKQELQYRQVIPYPFVERDISFIIDEQVPFSHIEMGFHNVKWPAFTSWKLMDRYSGKSIPNGKVSLTLRLIFQAPDRTLTSEEVDAMYEQTVARLTQDFHIELRK